MKGAEEISKSPRGEEVQRTDEGIVGDIPEIPRSPNRYEMLAEEGMEPKQNSEGSLDSHMELVKDIIAAIPPILAGHQGPAPPKIRLPS